MKLWPSISANSKNPLLTFAFWSIVFRLGLRWRTRSQILLMPVFLFSLLRLCLYTHHSNRFAREKPKRGEYDIRLCCKCNISLLTEGKKQLGKCPRCRATLIEHAILIPGKPETTFYRKKQILQYCFSIKKSYIFTKNSTVLNRLWYHGWIC